MTALRPQDGELIGPANPASSRLVAHLTRAIVDSARPALPGDSARAVLRTCMSLTQAARGRVYLLELSSGELRSFVQESRGDDGPRIKVGGLKPTAAPKSPPLERASATRVPVVIPDVANYGEARYRSSRAQSRLVIPVLRGRTCIGLIDLDSPNMEAFSPESVGSVETLANLLIPIYERRFALNLLSTLQEPVDFRVGHNEFFSAIGVLVALASGMEYAALREATEDGDLRCIAAWGFGEEMDLDRWNLTELDDYPPFARALHDQETVPVSSMDAPELNKLRERPEIAGVRSFVATPIKVASEVFGVLSVGTSCEYDFAPMETSGFESIANGVGVAITNYRNFHEATSDLARYSEVGVAITGMEVAQAARHEAKNLIDDCHTRLVIVRHTLGKNAAAVEQESAALDSDLSQINVALDKIKVAARPPTKSLKSVRIDSLWDQARSQVQGRLTKLKIQCALDGPKLYVDVYEDWFRQVFLNLLLNSADAFEERSVQRGRRIGLLYARPAERTNVISMTYTDNATGINPSKLKLPPGLHEQTLEQVIFEPNVTSKVDGSGWGLFLVRKILLEHRGSIDLVDYRKGATFKITLPRSVNEQT